MTGKICGCLPQENCHWCRTNLVSVAEPIVLGVRKPEAVEHPQHYGGADNPYEAIKVIEAWGLGFNLGNTTKYISRAGKKGDAIEDLRKASFYLLREIENREKAAAGGS